MPKVKSKFIAVARHRMQTDGEGVTTLCAFYGCPLRCKYCINPQSFAENSKTFELTPAELFERVKIDDLYFQATGGGVTFGGGEPLLNAEFLKEFKALCPKEWRLCAETSLNVSETAVRSAAKIFDWFFIDIKDMNGDIYKAYTGKSNGRVVENLKLLLKLVPPEKITVRIPLIPNYNTESDRASSVAALKEMGVTQFDLFDYIIKNKAKDK